MAGMTRREQAVHPRISPTCYHTGLRCLSDDPLSAHLKENRRGPGIGGMTVRRIRRRRRTDFRDRALESSYVALQGGAICFRSPPRRLRNLTSSYSARREAAILDDGMTQ